MNKLAVQIQCYQFFKNIHVRFQAFFFRFVYVSVLCTPSVNMFST